VLVLALNAGSSSLRLGVYAAEQAPRRVGSGHIDRIGLERGSILLRDLADGREERRAASVPDHAACVEPVLAWLGARGWAGDVGVVAHRVVHGGPHYQAPTRLDAGLVAELHRIAPFDPEHLPAALALLEAFAARLPAAAHVVCFDTAFHRDLPRVAQLLALPRRYFDAGVRRYGFHGLSYASLLRGLEQDGDPAAARGRLVLAHLGNGASLAAVRDGRCIDTTMAFTPASGVPMSTRSGDLDPGVLAYLARTEGLDAEGLSTLVNHRAGLLGVSGRSSDMRDLLAAERDDPHAAEAVALFCHSVRKAIGALAAALGGIDGLVFAGGIGEHAPVVRERICAGLDFLGIALDPTRNAAGGPLVSQAGSPVAVRVLAPDEEGELARSALALVAARS
jgi:acetate kinase